MYLLVLHLFRYLLSPRIIHDTNAKAVVGELNPSETRQQRIREAGSETAIDGAFTGAAAGFGLGGVPGVFALGIAGAEAGFIAGVLTQTVKESPRFEKTEKYLKDLIRNKIPFPKTVVKRLGLAAPLPPGDEKAKSDTPVVTSSDPNDIIGPSGFGDQNWLTPAQTLPYTIRFENQATATAAAVFITITHTLDADLDLTTLMAVLLPSGKTT